MKSLFIIVLVLIICVIVFKWLHKFKLVKVGSLVMVTGGVKTGKSTLSVWLVRSQLRSRRFKTRFMNFFRKIFNRQLKPIPQLYSNVPLNMDYIPLTDDLLLRKKRFVYNSVIYIQEASLVADSQYIRDMDVNDRLLLFNKLIAHETKGGVLIYDTQSP